MDTISAELKDLSNMVSELQGTFNSSLETRVESCLAELHDIVEEHKNNTVLLTEKIVKMTADLKQISNGIPIFVEICFLTEWIQHPIDEKFEDADVQKFYDAESKYEGFNKKYNIYPRALTQVFGNYFGLPYMVYDAVDRNLADCAAPHQKVTLLVFESYQISHERAKINDAFANCKKANSIPILCCIKGKYVHIPKTLEIDGYDYIIYELSCKRGSTNPHANFNITEIRLLAGAIRAALQK